MVANLTFGDLIRREIDELYLSPDCTVNSTPMPAVDSAGASIRGRTKWTISVTATLPGDFGELMSRWRADGVDTHDLE